MSDVNSTQVGGKHYKSSYQHWDWAIDVGLCPISYAATKYITRWPQKNGLEDLKKALHYTDKMIERHGTLMKRAGVIRPNIGFILQFTDRFLNANPMGTHEQQYCKEIALWRTLDDLHAARSHIKTVISEQEVQKVIGGGYVPIVEGIPIVDNMPKGGGGVFRGETTTLLEDSNKHADRD